MEDHKNLYRYIDTILGRLDKKIETYETQHKKQPSVVPHFASEGKSMRENNLTPPPRTDFTPNLTQKSLNIAKKLGNARERLLTPRRPIEIQDTGYSYTPRINKMSATLDRQRNLPKDQKRWDNLYNLHSRMKERIQEKRKEAEKKKEDKECTFTPKIIATSPSRPNREDWLNTWGLLRTKKINDLQDKEATKIPSECTFSPQIGQYRAINKDLMSTNGVDKFLERQETARRKKNIHQEGEKSAVLLNRDISNQQFQEARKDLHDALLNLRIS